MAKYSFIIPVYNGERHLKECIDSILKSDYGDFEIIAVDDGSTDKSGEILDGYSKENGKVKVFHKENGGVSSARNFGIEKASGEYLIFVDCDDTLKENALKEIDEKLKSYEVDFVVFGMSFDYYDKKGKIKDSKVLSVKHNGLKSADEFWDNFHEYFEDNALSSSCNKVYKASVIREHKICFDPKMILFEDLVFSLKYLAIADSAYFIPQPFYEYRLSRRENNIYKRSKNLDKVYYNVSGIVAAANRILEKTDSQSFKGTMQDLCLFLCYLNFFVNSYSLKETQSACEKLYEDEKISKFLSGVKQSETAAYKTFTLANKKEYKAVQRFVKSNRLKMRIKNFIKRILGKE